MIPALTGDACLGNAFALQQSRVIAAIPSSSSPNKGQGRGQAVPVYLHERGFAMMSEDHYLVAGLSASPYVVHTNSNEEYLAGDLNAYLSASSKAFNAQMGDGYHLLA